MSKKIKLIVLFLSINIYLVACSKSDITDENPGDADKSKDTTELTNVSKIINEESIDSSKITIELKKGLKDETLAIDTHDTYNYENLGINVKEYSLLLFCTDPVYGISYYVNYGEDFYIYRIKDGKSELAVEMPAKRLSCNEGKLYFILESYESFTFKGMKDGNILCYDPVSGDVSLICDVNADFMSVYEDGIYFKTAESITKGDNNQELWFFYYSFTTKKIDAIDDNFKTTIKWKEYFVTLEPDTSKTNKEGIINVSALKLETLDKSKSKKLADKVKFGSKAISDNKCYFYSGNDFIEYNLETDEVKKIQVPKDIPYGDFTIANGMIYFTNFYQYNIETGLLSSISPEANKPYIIYELYTDGINLYGICGLGSKTNGSIKRLVIMDNPNGFIKSKETDGVKYEINRLMYQALPIGEE